MTDSISIPASSLSDADAARRRRAIYMLLIAVAAGLMAGFLVNARPLLSANDRSRWCTVWSIVEEQTYVIDTIIEQPGWDTIDKVRYRDHFYSTKPALLPALVAGVYWCVKQVTGWNLLSDTAFATRSVLLFVNLLPLLAALVVLAATVERYARRDFTRYFVLLTAAVGTFLTTFLVTLNNHTVAAVSVVFALYPALRIVCDGSRRPLHFALCGFFAAFVCTNELPAALFGVAMFLLLACRAPGPTFKFFVPAALIPLTAFFAATYVASGSWKPFYLAFGKGPYNYVYEGVPSYWSNPSGLDANREPWYVYLLHCTIGHHGIFSLSPVFLLSAAGWISLRKWRDHALRPFLWLGLGLTAAILGFYLSRTGSYNYGGNTSGLRWMFWLIPFWLLAMIPVLDRLADSCWMKGAAALCLAISVFSAAYPIANPWQHPWLFRVMTSWGWIDYSETIPDFPRPRRTWFASLPQSDEVDEDYWIELSGPGADGTRHRLRLSDAGPATVNGRQVRQIQVEERRGDGEWTTATYRIEVAAFEAGRPLSEIVVSDGDEAASGRFGTAEAFLHGLPRLRESGYRRGKLRYVKTPLRRDAFECYHAAGQVNYRLPEAKQTVTARRELWLSREVPFGVLQVESTVYNRRTGELLARSRLLVSDVGKLLRTDEARSR